MTRPKRDIRDLVFSEPEVRFLWSLFLTSRHTLQWLEDKSGVPARTFYRWHYHIDKPEKISNPRLGDIKALLGVFGYELVIQPKKEKDRVK